MIYTIFKLTAVLVLAVSATACVQQIRHSSSGPLLRAADDTVRIATYNVHYVILSKDEGPWSVGDWQRRKGPMDAAFKAVDADVMGFQEMESFQRGDNSQNLTLDWLLSQNPDYAAGATGDPAQFPSTQPIFYRKDRFKLVDQGWYFFSDTHDVIYSRTFNGSLPAFATWVQLQDQNGDTFRVVNVHFEFKSASNRRLSTELVVKRTQGWVDAGETVILIGDLNARAGAEPLEMFKEIGFNFAPIKGSTYHLNKGLNLFGAIDHIAIAGVASFASDPVVLRQKFQGEWPTDHYPVLVDVRLGAIQ